MQPIQNNSFFYREVPVEYDGTGTLVDIKGNTVVFNQLAQNGNFESTSNWEGYRGTLSVSNNVMTFTSNNNDGLNGLLSSAINFQVNHKYLITFKIDSDGNTVRVRPRDPFGNVDSLWESVSGIKTLAWVRTLTTSQTRINIQLESLASGSSVKYQNVMCFDLTQMGLDTLTADQFTSLYPLPYYSYTQGKLLPFKGESLKTTGKNLIDEDIVFSSLTKSGDYFFGTSENIKNALASNISSQRFLPNTQYVLSCKYYVETSGGNGRFVFTYADGTTQNGYLMNSTTEESAVSVSQANKTIASITYDYGSNRNTYVKDVQLEINSSVSSYEPYTTSTLSLPISDKFPDGMDGVGTAFDEQTPTDYYKRMGMVDLGSLDWNYSGSYFYSSVIPNAPSVREYGVDCVCSKYPKSDSQYASTMPDKTCAMCLASSNDRRAWIKDSSYTTTSDLKSSLSGIYMYYPLATPLQNYGVVDLGNLTYTHSLSGTRHLFVSSSINDLKVNGQLLCSKYNYLVGGRNQAWMNSNANDYDFTDLYNTQQVIICNNSYSDPDVFKTAMSGIYLLYEMANPTHIDPPLDLTYDIWDDGTEQLLPENTSTPTTTPILCDIDYRTMIPVNADDDPDGSGVITGTGNYRYHSMATLTATPTDEIYRFLRWEDENGDTVSTNSTYAFEVGE